MIGLLSIKNLIALISGGVVEWYKALVLKTILRLSYIKGSGNIFQTWPDNVA